MFKYFETTALILLWSFVLSLIWAGIIYSWTSRAKANGRGFFGFGEERRSVQGLSQSWKTMAIISPGLLVAPLVLIFSHDFLGLNLLFPVHLTADFHQLLFAAMTPAFVLLLASGLLSQVTRQIPETYADWNRKTFVTMTKSYGGTPSRALRRIVMGEVLSRSWSQSLPWFFGELIVVECVFNAPGLGLQAWHEARVRDWIGLFESLLWLFSLYGAAVMMSALFSKWLGKRLESYS